MGPPMTEPTPLPWDTSAGNRFAPYTSDNHSATLWIISLLGLVYVVGVLLIRLFVKMKVLGVDDWLISASTVVAIGEFVSIYLGLSKGLATTTNSGHVEYLAKAVYTSRILSIVALYLAKCSGILLIRRLFVREDRINTLLCDLSLGFTIICGIASVFAGNVGCPSKASLQQHCDGQIMRWSIVTGLDVVTEIIALILPPYLVWQLQMKTSFKLRVITAFCFRIIVIVVSILYLNAWISYTNGPPSPFLVQPVLMWQQGLVAWGLISATIPNMKAFLQSLSTNWGIDLGYSSNAYGTNAYELGYLKRTGATPSATESEMPFSSHARAIGTKFKTEITTTIRERHVSGENGSIGSHGSQDLIIRKDTHVAIESERATASSMF